MATPANPTSTPVWSAQQQTVLAATDSRVHVIALAGTGKTETLLGFARQRPRARWRYLTFGRAMADAVQSRLPSNVRAGTFHALAHARFGAPLGAKLYQRFSADATRRAVGWATFPGWEAGVAALREWRSAFLASADPLPALGQLPPLAWQWLVARPDLLSAIGGPDGFIVAAERFWEATLDPRQGEIDAPGEVPVKRMALAGMDWGADGLLIDEAQDLTPCLAQALAEQKAVAVFAGDPAQALYGWRGAGCAWPPVKESTFPLTGSWRFGAEVAALANERLKHLGRSERLAGLRSDSSVSDGPTWQSGTTWIARTQAGAVAGALAALAADQHPGWVGRGTLHRLEALVDLAAGRTARDPWLAGLRDLDAVARVARESGDLEWRTAARLVAKTPGTRLEEALRALGSNGGTVSVATIHQSKGQTFARAALAPDLRWNASEEEEQRVNYVALTRSPHLVLDPATREACLTPGFEVPDRGWDDGF